MYCRNYTMPTEEQKNASFMPRVQCSGPTKTQFTSRLFQEFCSTYGFIHVTTSPPQANGFIERTVQTEGPLPEMQRSWCRSSSHHVMSLQHPTLPQHCITSRTAEYIYRVNLPSISKPGLSISADEEVNTMLQA